MNKPGSPIAIGFVQMAYALDFDLRVSFVFQHLRAVTITHKEYLKLYPEPDDLPKEVFGHKVPKRRRRQIAKTYLLIEGTAELEAYDSVTETAARLRPQLLIVHGILSFLTGEPFMAFQSHAGHHFVVPKHITATDPGYCAIDGVDHSADLRKILSILEQSEEDRKVLVYTLLERWRKALYLEKESEEANIHIDEAVLAHFQILEVLADEFTQELEAQKERQKEAV